MPAPTLTHIDQMWDRAGPARRSARCAATNFTHIQKQSALLSGTGKTVPVTQAAPSAVIFLHGTMPSCCQQLLRYTLPTGNTTHHIRARV